MSSSSSSEQTQTVATYPIIPKSDLIVKEQLGVGTVCDRNKVMKVTSPFKYGSVHKGIWKNGDKEVTVALKKVFMLEKEVCRCQRTLYSLRAFRWTSCPRSGIET